MPIWLRKYTFHEIKTFYEEESAAYEKAQGGGNTTTLVDSKGNINKPAWMETMKDTGIKKPNKPTYMSKMSKKS